MLGQERRVHLGLGIKTQMNTPFFGSCRGYVGFLLVRTGGSYLHLLFGLYFANLGFKKTGHDSITKLPGLGPSQTRYVVLFRVTDKSAPQFR